MIRVKISITEIRYYNGRKAPTGTHLSHTEEIDVDFHYGKVKALLNKIMFFLKTVSNTTKGENNEISL